MSDDLKRLATFERRQDRLCMISEPRRNQKCENEASFITDDGFRVCVEHRDRIDVPCRLIDHGRGC